MQVKTSLEPQFPQLHATFSVVRNGLTKHPAEPGIHYRYNKNKNLLYMALLQLPNFMLQTHWVSYPLQNSKEQEVVRWRGGDVGHKGI